MTLQEAQSIIDSWTLIPSQFGGWPAIPNEANTVNLCTPITDLPRLPPEIPFFKIQHTNISSYSSPTKVQILYLIDNPFLESVTDLPEGLTNLELQNLPSLCYIDEFPSTLKYLSIKRCNAIITLPPLPEGLRVFTMEHCNSVKFIPQQLGVGTLPQIKFMSVHDCVSLIVPCRPRKKNSLFKALDYGMEFYDATRYTITHPDNPLDDPYRKILGKN